MKENGHTAMARRRGQGVTTTMRSTFIFATALLSYCNGFGVPRTKAESATQQRAFLNVFAASGTSTLRDEKILTFVEKARAAGPVGRDCPQEEQEALVSIARNELARLSDPRPARIPLSGLHKLVYSAAPGGSSGKVGPFVGKVTQEFVDDVTFINSVSLGPLKISLRAEREVKSDTAIKVSFRETTVTLFGNQITSKTIENSGGVWKYLFSGVVTSPSGQRKIIRIMETPSLFVLEQDLN